LKRNLAYVWNIYFRCTTIKVVRNWFFFQFIPLSFIVSDNKNYYVRTQNCNLSLFFRYPLNVLEERGLSENPILYQFDTTPVFVAIPSKYNIAVSIGSFTLHTFSEDNLDTSSIRAIHTCKEQQCISRDGHQIKVDLLE